MKTIKNWLNALKKSYSKIDKFCDKAFDTTFKLFSTYQFLIVAITLSVLALTIRVIFLDYISGDLAVFIRPWLAQIKGLGGFNALKVYPDLSSSVKGDYPVAYINILCLISYLPINHIDAVKLVGFTFDFALAFASYLIVSHFTKNKMVRLISYLAVLFTPTVILNSALWGQCDQIYVSFLLYCFYFLIKGKNNKAMIFLGFAFSFKIQAVFFLPILVFMWINKKFKLRSFLIIALPILLTFIPSWLAGAPFTMPFTMLVGQIGLYSNANYGAGNLYAFLELSSVKDGIKNGAGVAIAFSVISFIFYLLYYYKVKCNDKNLVYVATLFALICPFVLPHMHERYFFLADILIIIFSLVYLKKYFLAVLVHFASFLAYTHFLLGDYVINFLSQDSVRLAAILNFIVIVYIFKEFKNLQKAENPSSTL